MRFKCDTRERLGRGFVLLAPPQCQRRPFRRIDNDPSRYEQLLTQAQILRGRVYLEDQAIQPWELRNGRHVQPADASSWHLLTLDEHDRVAACIRYLAHPTDANFLDLAVSRSNLARSPETGPALREAIETDMQRARRQGFSSYVELGGWAISEELRCSTEAIRTLLTAYALAQILGGARALSTATTRHHSASILRRVGGTSLTIRGAELPAYYDPQYKCEMELISFDSASPNPRYTDLIRQCRSALPDLPIISAESAEPEINSLQNLRLALSGTSKPQVGLLPSVVA